MAAGDSLIYLSTEWLEKKRFDVRRVVTGQPVMDNIKKSSASFRSSVFRCCPSGIIRRSGGLAYNGAPADSKGRRKLRTGRSAIFFLQNRPQIAGPGTSIIHWERVANQVSKRAPRPDNRSTADLNESETIAVRRNRTKVLVKPPSRAGADNRRADPRPTPWMASGQKKHHGLPKNGEILFSFVTIRRDHLEARRRCLRWAGP